MQSFYTSQQNTENNELQLQQIITSLKDNQRETLFEVAKELIGNSFSLVRTDPENTFSPHYVDVDGENLKYSSTGTRLLLTLLGTLLDAHFTTLLIDEPEIGLSPRIQVSLANFLYDEDKRKTLFPHLQQLYIVTHSHLFLDRSTLSNNYMVTKSGNMVDMNPVRSIGDFHHLQFEMLGNELESLFLPSVIIIVEGGSDRIYMAKIMQLHIPERKIAIIRAGGDGEVQSKLNVLKEAFGDLMTSPYRDRLFVALDKKHSVKTARIQKQGVQKDNIFVWSKNGIEYLYPPELIAAAFCCDQKEVPKIEIEKDPIEFNGIRKSKKELAQFVADQLTANHSLNAELENLVTKVQSACK